MPCPCSFIGHLCHPLFKLKQFTLLLLTSNNYSQFSRCPEWNNSWGLWSWLLNNKMLVLGCFCDTVIQIYSNNQSIEEIVPDMSKQEKTTHCWLTISQYFSNSQRNIYLHSRLSRFTSGSPASQLPLWRKHSVDAVDASSYTSVIQF